MRFSHSIMTLSAAFLVCASATAEPVPAEPALAVQTTLKQLIDQALTRSPAVQAKRRAYEAARARVIAAWLPDDPEAGVDVEGQSDLFDHGSRANREYMVSQAIPFPTTLLLRGQAASREAQMAYQQYREAQRDAIWHIEQPYYELFMTKKTLGAMEEVRSLLERLGRSVQAKYETNQASQQDVLKAQIELAKAQIELVRLREQEHLAEAHFSHLLDQSLFTRYELPEEPVSPPLSSELPELERLAIESKPELLAMAEGIRRAKTNRLLAYTSWLPNLTGRIEGRQFPGEGSVREWDNFVGVTVPVWSLLKGASGEWKAAHKDVRQAEALYTEMKNEVLLDVHEAYAKVSVAGYALQQYEQAILPQARQQVQVALAAFEAGRADFLELIDAQRMLRDAEIAYATQRAEYERGLADVRFAVGGPIS